MGNTVRTTLKVDTEVVAPEKRNNFNRGKDKKIAQHKLRQSSNHSVKEALALDELDNLAEPISKRSMPRTR